jgi:type IV secretory pathway protease TraF
MTDKNNLTPTYMRLLRWVRPCRQLLFGGLVLLVMTDFTYNVSDSAAPTGVYHIARTAKVDLGDLVILRMPIKQVWALPGDSVRFAPEGVYSNGELIPNSGLDPKIPRACPFGDYTVPPGMFLGMGANDPDSWDGRFVCFLPQSLIMGTVKPVYAWRAK